MVYFPFRAFCPWHADLESTHTKNNRRRYLNITDHGGDMGSVHPHYFLFSDKEQVLAQLPGSSHS